MAATDTKPTGRKGDKVIRDALLAALRQDPDKLKRVADKAWSMAEEGNMQAFKEISDRIDGKAAQPLVGGGEDDNPIQLSGKIEIVHVKAPISNA